MIPSSTLPPALISSSTQAGSTIEPITLYFQNVRGLKTKIDEFFLACNEGEFDIVILVETWLDDRINSVQLFVDAYSVYRVDRSPANSIRKVGGGVLIAVRKTLDSVRCTLGHVEILEQIFVKVRLHHRTLYIGAFYLPCEKRFEGDLMQLHVDAVDRVRGLAQLHDVLVVAGDYNQPNLVWKMASSGHAFVDSTATRSRSRNEAAVQEILLDGMARSNLHQIQSIPNANGRILDLLFISDDLLIPAVHDVADPLVSIDSHHPALSFALDTVQLPDDFDNDIDLESLNFRNTDFDAMKQELSIVDWSPVISSTSTDEAAARFGHIVRVLLNRFTPQRRAPRKPPWSNARLKRMKRKRSAALRLYSSRRDCILLRRKFKEASQAYRRYNALRYTEYIRRTQQDLRRIPKRFWSFVKSKYKENGLPSTMVYKDETASNTTLKCQLFARHFQSVFSDPATNSDTSFLEFVPADLVHFDTFTITENMIHQGLKKLKSTFVPGPDGIPGVVLKRCGPELTAPLLKVFNMSMQDAEFPTEWKKSYMFPIFKKGEKRDIENYRGITSLSSCSKLLEIIVCEALVFSCRNYISPEQHGFVAGRSVTTNLMEFVSTCFDSISKGSQVDAVYTDLTAAFDCIDHNIALQKFSKLGFSVRMCKWFESYLKGRCIQVKLGSTLSDVFTNRSGVPQGSNIAPKAFALFFMDVGYLFHGNCKLAYADDFKLFVTVESLADCYVLQSHINAFVDWCRKNLMKISIKKCQVISFHHKTSREVFSFDYTINDQSLERVNCVKDLGVWLDCKLTFRNQQSAVIEKANRQLGFMFKISREFDDPFCLRALYYALVRSHLESSVIIWTPYHRNWIDRMEKIQRKFVWFAGRNFNWSDPFNLPPYEHRCALLGMMPLEKRTTIAKAVFAAKLLTGDIDCPNLLERLGTAVQARDLRPRVGFLHRASSSSEYMRHSPFRSMCDTFNQFYEQFEFDEPATTFRNKLINKLSILGQLEEPEHPPRVGRVRHPPRAR